MRINFKRIRLLLYSLLTALSAQTAAAQHDHLAPNASPVIPASSPMPLPKDSFFLNGTAPELLNGHMIYIGTLDYSGLQQGFMDSTRIENGHFRFTGHLPQTAMLTTIHIRQPRLAIDQFYLENRTIDMTILPDSGRNLFGHIIYHNAPITNQNLDLQQQCSDINKRSTNQMRLMDSLWKTASDSARNGMEAQLRTINREKRVQTIEYIKAHPDSYFSLYQLCYFVADVQLKDADQLQQVLMNLSQPLQQMPEAQRLMARITQKKAIAPGNIAPWKPMLTNKNETFDLNRWKGKYVILDFWASWCGPCIQNLPALKQLYSNFHAQGIEVVGISLDDKKEHWINAIQKHDLPWPQVSDLQGWKNEIAQLYDVRAIPQYVLVGQDGKIITAGLDLNNIREKLQQLTTPNTHPTKH